MGDCELTVIIPMYNCCDNVCGILEELNRQNEVYPLNVVVVDDGSTEDVSRVKILCEAFEFIYVFQKNAGGAAACNKGLEFVFTDFFTFVDADDFITPNYLDSIYCYLGLDNVDFLINRWQYRDGEIGGRHEAPLMNWNVWGNVYRSSLFKRTKFDEDINVAWDIDWLRRAYEEAGSPEPTVSDEITNIYDTSNPESITNKFNRGEITVRKSDTQNNS